ncbi:MAG: AAA family ATPase, partial [Psychrosphaera sp.]|nr:AAA family ATPase [Psychrosphaera sp.]
MTLNLKYPLGTQTFSKIIEDQLLYVDKTAIIGELLRGGSVYFLSRPRRFGKSLLISTLDALFSGRKELFEGLAIADTDYDFVTYPVMKLEFAKDEFNTADNLRSYISNTINRMARRYNIELIEETYNQRFDELLGKLYEQTGQKVVVLIDEYDKPILNNLKNKPVLDEIKQVMSAFYGAIKSMDEYLRFVFITGVSKFAKVSIFSGMNSLTDLTMHKRYATLCGITEQEL